MLRKRYLETQPAVKAIAENLKRLNAEFGNERQANGSARGRVPIPGGCY